MMDLRRRALISVSERKPEKDYLCFTAALPNSSVTITPVNDAPIITIETSYDGYEWHAFTPGTTIIELKNIGNKVYFRGENMGMCNRRDGDKYNKFVMTGKISASGNMLSILSRTLNTKKTLDWWFFSGTFRDCASLIQAPKLPDITSYYGFSDCFRGCTGLTDMPEMPNVPNPTHYSYRRMFSGCTGLTRVGNLQGNANANVYEEMFSGCKNLMAPAKMYSTSYAYRACYRMYNNCAKIKISEIETSEYKTPFRIPEVGEGTTVETGLQEMFRGTGGTFTGTPDINKTYYLAE